MKRVSIEGTSQTPAVTFDPETGILEIRGRSIPENAAEFYIPLLDWIEAYSETPQPVTKVNIRFEYLNTSSSKLLYSVFHKLELLSKSGHHLEINWFYEKEDEEMMETGEDFQDILKLPFTFIEEEE